MAELHDTFRLLSAVGDGIILTMYLMLVTNKISQESWGYMISNVIGSCMVLFDVVAEFSVSQLLVQSGWLLVSAVAFGAALKVHFFSGAAQQRAANDMHIPDSDVVVSIHHQKT